jgi:hypothetical protein
MLLNTAESKIEVCEALNLYQFPHIALGAVLWVYFLRIFQDLSRDT